MLVTDSGCVPSFSDNCSIWRLTRLRCVLLVGMYACMDQTEQDFAEIAGAGLNWVRLPIPFWAIDGRAVPREGVLEVSVPAWGPALGVRTSWA
jgi:hypothetical protein